MGLFSTVQNSQYETSYKKKEEVIKCKRCKRSSLVNVENKNSILRTTNIKYRRNSPFIFFTYNYLLSNCIADKSFYVYIES